MTYNFAVTSDSAEVNPDQAILDLHREYCHVPAIRRQRLAARRTEAPGMPGAHHGIALKHALPQRRSAMRAPVIERPQLAVYVRHADRCAVDLYLRYLTRRGCSPQRTHSPPLRHLRPAPEREMLEPELRRMTPRRTARPQPPQPTEAVVEVVDPRWLIKAFVLTVAVAALFGYATVCWIFWQGDWQLVLHPSRTVTQTPARAGLGFQPVSFGSTGNSTLTGWWVPAPTATSRVALVLGSGDGSMADSLPAVTALHAAGLHVLAFDYRGYGTSSGKHPTEASMREDTRAALHYLLGTRGVPPSQIVPFGIGAGASLAIWASTQTPGLPAVILQSAKGDFRSYIIREKHSRLLPVSLLFHEDFPLAKPLGQLPTPKLLISYTAGVAPEEFKQAADPKTTLELLPGSSENAAAPAIRTFVDSYLR